MRLLNPWALAGLVLVAAPVVAHLLARRPARRLPFPTLRFLPASTPRPVSRERLTDLALLALRCAIVAGAAFALAQPLWLSGDRARDLGRQIARAIIVDTSASMRRPADAGPAPTPTPPEASTRGNSSGPGGSIGPPGGRSNGLASPTGVDRARERARSLAAEATVARVVESAAPATLVAGASAWLAAQPMRRELVIVSDFQTGTIGRPDLVDLAADTGVRLEQIAAAGPVAPAPRADDGPVTLLAGDRDRELAEAARVAASATGAPERTGPVAVMFPGYPGRAELLRTAGAPRTATGFDVFERVLRDPLVVESVGRQERRVSELVSGVEATVNGRQSLVISLASEPAPSEAAAVVRAASIAASAAWVPERERSTEVIPPAELDALRRDPPESAAGQPGDDSHGRWIWLAVIALLLVEQVIRRRRPAPETETQEAPRARVA